MRSAWRFFPDGATEWVKIADGTVDALCNSVRDAWSQVTINLKDFAGKSVQLRFICKTMHFLLNTALDNIRVADLLDHDIKCAEIMAPKNLYAARNIMSPSRLRTTVSAMPETTPSSFMQTMCVLTPDPERKSHQERYAP